ncbi:MAG TPA: nucleoside hydrolase [Ramlibacter sp.]|nr:nucleoside hydrolase [Ramlibacter sp.]
MLCRLAGKDIPIYPGAEQPTQGAQRQQIAQQAVALPRWPHETDFPAGQPLKFMACTIRKHPGEATLLTVGPLTNAGLLFSAQPDVTALPRGLVMMAGAFDKGLSPDE